MRATLEEYWNTAAILDYCQHSSRQAIQNFCLRDRNLIVRNSKKKKKFLRWTSMTSIRHTRDVIYRHQ